MEDLNTRQRDFAARSGGRFIGPGASGGSEAICHTYLVENVARSGDVIVGTDSHTCSSGTVGAFAFGVGATDIATAWYTRQVLVISFFWSALGGTGIEVTHFRHESGRSGTTEAAVSPL